MRNESSNAYELYTRVARTMDNLQDVKWELVCVNDGSTDDTLQTLLQIHERDARLRIVDLSRKFGKEAALSAGLSYASGDAVIPMDADLQDPPELIPQLIGKWQDGYEVVNACRESRPEDAWLKRVSARVFYWLINRISQVEIPSNVGDFRLLSRPAVDAILDLPERRRFMKGLFAWIGFRTTQISYTRPRRHAGQSQWQLTALLRLAVEGLTAFGQVPLQLVSYIGLVVSLIAFVYGTYMIGSTLLFGNPVAGYPSIMVTVLFLGGVQLLGLGVIGEYLGRVYDETKHRPLYVVRRTWGPISTHDSKGSAHTKRRKDAHDADRR